MNILEKTGVPIKTPGMKLSAEDINKINSTTNNCVDAINYLLVDTCNINEEVGDHTRSFTLAEAIKLVPSGRRYPGILIRFKEKTTLRYEEYTYMGDYTNTAEFENPENWGSGISVIDGGEWS